MARCVRQQDQSDCGAAALATITGVSLQRARDLTGTDTAGTNMLGLVEAARKLGYEARGVEAPFEALRDLPMPAIAHLGDHFVVLHDAKKLLIADPAEGVRRWSAKEFQGRWTGRLVLLVPSMLTSETPKSPWRRILHLLGTQKSALTQTFLCAFLMAVLALVGSLFIQQLLDSILVHQRGGLLNMVGLGMLLLLAFRVVFSTMRGYLLAHMSRKVDLGLLQQFYRHVLRQPVAFFESRRVGDILSRMSESSKVREVIGGTSVSLLLDGVVVAIAATAMLLTSASVAMVALAALPVFAIAFVLHVPALRRSQRLMMEETAELQGRLVEDVSAIETIKAFGVEEERQRKTESAMMRLVRQVFRNQMFTLSLSGMSLLMSGLGSLLVLWYGGHRVIGGELSLGQLMFFSSLLGFVLGPAERLVGVLIQAQDAAIALERMGEVLDLPAEPSGREKFSGLRSGIRFENVSFRYGYREFVLRNIDLEIPVGKTVAIVGPSGCGKSTLCKLLMGFHRPTEGRILLDDLDLRDYDLGTLRRKCGWVQQEPQVFSGTIRENIAFGHPASLAEIVAAARSAQVAGFIDTLPERYETRVAAANLSGGQRQRIAIARAMLRRPELLVLDEATSHLDTATEAAMRLTGRTVVVIAHRLSTVRNADLIVVMDRGRIVERGTHEELLAAEGKYAELWGVMVA